MPRKVPPKITAVYLERVTTWYLERRATSAAHLRRLLVRRVCRSAEEHGTDRTEGEALVDAEIQRLLAIRLLDDDRYAADKARSLRRKGASTSKVRAALRAKGLDQVTVDAVPSEGPHEDWTAACTWARKRRLGPWRTGRLDDELRRKELGRLGRAGFPWDIARRIVDATDPDDLEAPT